MIISHKYRFIFIKTRKTAGTSIEVFLSSHCDENDIFTPIEPHVEPHRPRNHAGYYNHISAQEVCDQIGEDIWRSYFTFCVERNPWDKTLSYYHMIKARTGKELSFEEFLSTRNFCSDYSMYTSVRNPNSILVNRVLSYEKLDLEINEVFEQLGIPFGGTLNVWAKSEYRTDRKPYRKIYTPQQAALISREFDNELALFGYEF